MLIQQSSSSENCGRKLSNTSYSRLSLAHFPRSSLKQSASGLLQVTLRCSVSSDVSIRPVSGIIIQSLKRRRCRYRSVILKAGGGTRWQSSDEKSSCHGRVAILPDQPMNDKYEIFDSLFFNAQNADNDAVRCARNKFCCQLEPPLLWSSSSLGLMKSSSS